MVRADDPTKIVQHDDLKTDQDKTDKDKTKTSRPRGSQGPGAGRGFRFGDPIHGRVAPDTEARVFEHLELPGTTFDDLKVLGSGGMGTAFLLPNGKVLKVTTDQYEPYAAAAVMKSPADVLFKVYDVFQFQATPKPLSAIVQEPLKDLTDSSWIEFLRGWFRWARAGQPSHIAEEDEAGNLKVLYKTVTRENVEAYRQTGDHDANKLSWLEDVADALARAHVEDFADMKPSNVMTRGGRPVLIDLGVSRAPRAALKMIARLLIQAARRIETSAGLLP
jgi:hypothetical protein